MTDARASVLCELTPRVNLAGTNGRAYRVYDGLPDIKSRNAAKRALEADGFDVETGGYKGNYRASGSRGEKPTATREKFGIGTGLRETLPLYRTTNGDGWETIDGTPERDA